MFQTAMLLTGYQYLLTKPLQRPKAENPMRRVAPSTTERKTMENVENLERPPAETGGEDDGADVIAEALGERETPGPKSRRVRMTPTRAEKIYTECNTNNRPFSQAEAEKLKHEILAGRWRYNGEAVKISKTNKLMDGQHRLWAIWQSGVTCDILLVVGLDDEVFSTMDQGRKRSGGDVLAIRGVKRHSLVANAAAMLYRILQDKPVGAGVAIPAYGIEKIWERHPTLVQAVEVCVPIYQRGGDPVITLPYLAAFRYLLDPIMAETEKAASLVEGLVIGAELKEDDPMFRFRQRVLDTRKRSAHMTGGAKLALLSKTVGMHITGERVGRSMGTPDAAEKFSTFIPGMTEALAALTPADRLDDLDY